ncbi:MAG TPA: WYL domain-containing protein [Anaerolineales bacterium]|nr:WYL domain-containing protein [Anaerolineales bacterium]
MRADRLLSLLMLLKTRGKMTARQLAQELEVSERTIYRDIVALSTSGVPVYTEDGPGGGISLIESYTTDLTGLNAEEVRALAMLNVPEPLNKLGVGRELRAAMFKLSAALPSTSRENETRTRQRIHLDATGWFEPEEPVPHLQTIQNALFHEHKLHLTWREFRTSVEQSLTPYGLVAKSNTWYLVAGKEGHIRVLRVSRIIAAQMLPETFEYPQDFNLAAFWKCWCEEFQKNRPIFLVTARVSPALLAHLPHIFGEQTSDILARASAPDKDGFRILILPFESFESARARILGLGRAIEVLEPLALRMSVIDFAQQIASLYSLDK